MPEENKAPLELVTEKFTKANVYSALKEVNQLRIDGGDFESALNNLIDAVKPQKGGGASANPMKVIDGVNFHYCRFKDDYVEESLMNMTAGKSKGTSILASKVAYRIGRAAEERKAEALKSFIAGDYETGAQLNAEADELEKTIESPATFTDEAMAESIYHPDFGKSKEEESENTTQPADNAELI